MEQNQKQLSVHVSPVSRACERNLPLPTPCALSTRNEGARTHNTVSSVAASGATP